MLHISIFMPASFFLAGDPFPVQTRNNNVLLIENRNKGARKKKRKPRNFPATEVGETEKDVDNNGDDAGTVKW